MNVQQAYNQWSSQYDTNENKTRDLEAVALREILSQISFTNCLEIGCGTGKNTEWLAQKTKQLTAVDFSEQMLQKAKEKVRSGNVQFTQADITQPWNFTDKTYDLVSFSLVLEHIENLESIFEKAAAVTTEGSYVYIGELHPFKQYTGSKARFETSEGLQVVHCFTHHLSDFIEAAAAKGFSLLTLREYFDAGDKTNPPRMLALLFQKQ